MDFNQLVQTLLVYALPVLFSITLHEAAHGYAARRLGDDTAQRLGRITLNPLKHIDPIGTVLMPLALYIATAGSFAFGYAKPVPVDFSRLRQPRRDMVWVALAGPMTNFAQALAWGMLLVLFTGLSVDEPFFVQMARAGLQVNLVMWALNLFPLLPLDGGRVLAGLLPPAASQAMSRIEPLGFFIVMALLLAGVINHFWMSPLMQAGYFTIALVLQPLRAVF